MATAAIAQSDPLTAEAPPLPDTEVTPQPKATGGPWVQVGGAPFGSETKIDGSPTEATVDLYTVRFLDVDHGFAGGAACADATCSTRVPVIYEYGVPEGGVGRWQESFRGTEPGYVGAIAFIEGQPDRAIAVGGTGKYPRRELAWPADGDYLAADRANGAGSGRVWTYNGDWQRVDPTTLPDDPADRPMGGLTAVDCTPRATEGEFCFAGGMQQLFMWKDGGFVNAYGPQRKAESGAIGPDENVDGAQGFRFRIRQIGFVPGLPKSDETQVVAMMAGCCGPDETRNQPRALLFESSKWAVRLLADDATLAGGGSDANTRREASPVRSLSDTPYAFSFTRNHTLGAGFANTQFLSVVMSPGGSGPLAAAGLEPEPVVLGRVWANPDKSGTSTEVLQDALATGCGCAADATQGGSAMVVSARVSSLRLVAGDGDFAGPPNHYPNPNPFSRSPTPPDGTVDWAVGEMRDTGRGAAYTTLDPAYLPAESVKCPAEAGLSVGGDPLSFSKCTPDKPEDTPEKLESRRLFLLPSWSLNGFTFAPGSSVAWAVGDKGAIVRFGGSGGLGATTPEPPAPRLGAKTAAPLPDNSAYDERRPLALSGKPGIVPALASRPLLPGAARELVPVGSPDPSRAYDAAWEDVGNIVMSRDGSEGWALGTGPGAGARARMTLYHYDGERWTSCEAQGLSGQFDADPACASLGVLRSHDETGSPVTLLAAARVPLERDGDKSNDDEFEVVAITSKFKLPHSTERYVVLRYRDGRWRVDEDATRGPIGELGSVPTTMAFTTPDDGWVAGENSGPQLVHFNGEEWVLCNGDPGACGDTGARLPLEIGQAENLRLVAAADRVYFAGTRKGVAMAGETASSVLAAAATTSPMILSKKAGEQGWRDDWDPGFDGSAELSELGKLLDLGIVETPDGPRGWATGVFGAKLTELTPPASSVQNIVDQNASGPFDAVRRASDMTPLLRLGPGGWSKWRVGAAADRLSGVGEPVEDYLFRDLGRFAPVVAPDGSAVVAGISNTRTSQGTTPPLAPMLRFDPGAEQWSVLATPFMLSFANTDSLDAASTQASPRAIAPDGRGGFWLAVRQAGTPSFDELGRRSANSISFFHYTGAKRQPVFEDIAHPVRERITTATSGPDGSFWVGTASNSVYRYDRITGWDRVGMKGWDPGRLVTNPSPVNAIAVGPDGRGLAVGRGGRIAHLSRVGAILDLAAGSSCSTDPDRAGGCGTGRDLRAAAVASDGSAMVGGDARALLWRSATGTFRAINPPTTAPSAGITGIAMPTPGVAWVTTELGQVFRGTGGEGGWSWRKEAVDSKSRSLTADPNGTVRPLRAIAIDASERGFAVGDGGAVLERSADGTWKRLETGFRDDFRTVALPAAGASAGALIGGVGGVVLTHTEGRFAVARAANHWDPLVTGRGTQMSGRIVGLGIAPGTADGQVEAWAAMQVPAGAQSRESPPGAILHYTSDPDEPLLNPARRAEPLPDTPAPRPGEISFAAFGRSDCHFSGACPELHGTNLTNDVIARRVADEITAASKRPGGPQFAVFTGDIGHAAGRDRSSPDKPGSADTPLDNNVVQRRWVELVAERFRAGGVPLFGALGPQDLSQAQSCLATGNCVGTRQAKVGTSLQWRTVMAGMAAPWGTSGKAPVGPGGITFESVEELQSPGPGGGARTHYAVDVVKGERTLARMVVVDTSLRSLEASKVNQNPVERGTQLDWVDKVLASRPAGAQAIVVSATPTYSYGPPAPSDTQADATTFESILFKNRANVLVSGRLGWNALYWATAPGLHFPCPGGSYPDQLTETPPPGSAPNCTGTGQEAAVNTDAATARVADALRGLGAPPPPEAVSNLVADTNATGLLPQVVAASAGGTFGPDGQGGGSASDGYWHGYTVVRVAPPNGDVRDHRPDQTIVEQRPVFDWIGISAVSHRLAPGQKLTLRGFGREPVGMDTPPRYNAIDSPAITHRYDLVEADPQRPYLPRKNADGEYVKLDPSIGAVDPVTGRVTTGKGSHPRVFAIGLLSVGAKAATWPIVFEPRASYRPPVLNIIKPAIPPVPPRPPITVLSTGVSSLPSTPPPAPPPPIATLALTFPAPPVIPGMPPLSSSPVNPPTPPVPPPPPASVAPTALDLVATPVGLNVPPQTSPIPPPSPPIQPAPPGGARKEARQRQAAVAKSEEGSGEGAGEGESAGENGSSQSYSRHDIRREPLAFTAVARREQPSAWARGLAYGGGITVMAFLLSTTWLVARPRHRRREPIVPAQAWVRDTRRDG